MPSKARSILPRMISVTRNASLRPTLDIADEQNASGVLLYAPDAIRLASLVFFVVGVVFSILYISENWGDTRLVLIRLLVVLLTGLGTTLTFIFVRKYYRAWVLIAALLGISATLWVVTYMDGPNINPHAAIVVLYVMGAGFCLGRRGVIISSIWLVLNYLLLILLSYWNVWPQPPTVPVAKLQYENVSAIFFLMLILLPVLLGYLALVEQSIKQLKGSHQEQQRLLQRLIAVQEGEREHIAHILHEGTIQDMAALRLAVLNEQSTKDVILVIDTMLQQLRTLSGDLYPASLHLYGLPTALDQLAAQHERASYIQIQVSHTELQCSDPQIGIVLYRIAQEALNNVRKHSNAQHVWANLGESNNVLSLEVRDDGQGFDVEPVQRQAVQTGHLGLATLHELALSVGGTLGITSQPGQGTIVTVAVPSLRSTTLHADVSGATQLPKSGD